MNFNLEWRTELRTGRFAGRRQQACALRANTRTRPHASVWLMSWVLRRLWLKLLEGRLRLAKNFLKIQRIYTFDPPTNPLKVPNEPPAAPFGGGR